MAALGRPIVDRVMPLSLLNGAYGVLDSGTQFGKVVITIDQS
jgi:hypothetical protein